MDGGHSYVTFASHEPEVPVRKEPVVAEEIPSYRPIFRDHNVAESRHTERNDDTITLQFNTNFIVGGMVSLLVLNVVLIFLVVLLLVTRTK